MNMYGRHNAVGHYTPEVLSTDIVMKPKTRDLISCSMPNNSLAVICASSRDNTPDSPNFQLCYSLTEGDKAWFVTARWQESVLSSKHFCHSEIITVSLSELTCGRRGWNVNIFWCVNKNVQVALHSLVIVLYFILSHCSTEYSCIFTCKKLKLCLWQKKKRVNFIKKKGNTFFNTFHSSP